MSTKHAVQSAPLPANERERIQALHALRILDTDPEPLFDDLARLAAVVTACPIALVSLVDVDRQWFKARCGIGSSETDRSLAFCAHAILSAELMEVPDTHEDPRFAQHPLVLGEPRIRFYAGMPLASARGFCYGTLCVIDRVPRRLTAAQREQLAMLARQVVFNMEARVEKQQSFRHSVALARLLEFLPDALITADTAGNIQLVNSIARRWHGVDPGAVPPERWHQYFQLFAGDGRLLPVRDIPLNRVLRGERVRNEEFVIRARGQAERIVQCNGDFLVDEDGRHVGAVVVLHDITALKRADQRIASARTHLQGIVDASSDVAIITTDTDGLITLFNTGARNMLGYAPDEVVGKATPVMFHLPAQLIARAEELTLLHGADASDFDALVFEARRGGTETRQWTYVRRDGARRQVRLSVSALHDEDGRLLGFLAMAIDLTRQLEAEEAARLSGERFHGAFASAAQGMALVSLAGQWVESNDELCRMLGYAREELLALDFQSLTHPEDIARDLQEVQALLAGRTPSYHLEKRYVRKNGELMYALLSVSLVRDRAGRPLHFVAQIQDITQQKRAGEALADSERYLQALFDNVADAIVVFTGDGAVVSANRAAARLLGSSMLPGGNVYERLPGLQHYVDHGAAESSRYFELRGEPGTGESLPVAVALSEVPFEGLRRWVAILRDLSEQKRMERMKDEFVSTVSHELRTPLTSIAGALSLIQGGVLGEVPGGMRDMLGLASQNSQRLTGIINDLLDMDKLIAGKMSFAFAAHPLDELLDDALAAMRSYAGPLDVTLVRGERSGVVVWVDAMRLMQVLANLLSNACKFSPRGGRVVLDQRVAEGGVVVRVSDEGPGIPADFRDRIFQKFSQADTGDSRSKGGTGLGLVICKQLVERMQGEIGFESAVGRGSCFWFRLPLHGGLPDAPT